MADIEKASRDAVDAADQAGRYEEILAVVAAVQQQGQQAPACQHQQAPAPAKPGGSAVRWLAIGMGGSALLLSVAVSAVAVAISAVALTICLLVLRSIWTDMRKGG